MVGSNLYCVVALNAGGGASWLVAFDTETLKLMGNISLTDVRWSSGEIHIVV